jgi:hypothetical protein
VVVVIGWRESDADPQKTVRSDNYPIFGRKEIMSGRTVRREANDREIVAGRIGYAYGLQIPLTLWLDALWVSQCQRHWIATHDAAPGH